MHVTLVCSALPGMGPRAVCERASAAWREVRPYDDVLALLTSEGAAVAHAGTGLDDVVQSRHLSARAVEVGAGAERRVHWVWDGGAMIDLADSFSWNGRPEGSTAFLGADLLALRDAGARRIHVHLPDLMSPTDLGRGVLGELAGESLGDDGLGAALEAARAALRDMALTVTYPSDLPLLGVNGMARAWATRGFDGYRAQDFEREAGAWIHELGQAAGASTRRSLVGADIDPRAGYAGPGGGLGLMLQLLGASTSLVGDHLVAGHIPETDLIVYVLGTIGVDLPSGLHAAARSGEEQGVPVVVLSDAAGMRKGELPRLGLHGAYEMRPERFVDDADTLADLSRLPQLVTTSMRTIASTWGWD
ncbi:MULTISPECIES: hypothetical protein [Trueperella]|uniref:Glycerate kinase n=1 Tax=Trueperella bernardiae TaxID=59561 RepID=A0A0W1KMY0_9ACTO|nr:MULTISPECIES: hypothetical protein [Trueperella]KTF04892.1 hypothetical protein AQZ59_00195 [Trueperella bernardiae]MCM3906494.1 hypothetical protein [Trueperella bernardiae]MDV6238542.1 hypothetical protein [Trueperella bernardiae]OCW61022.1 hypothetical protein AKG36_00890 [Trueperella bernardiae]OFS68671.1 hypothetical protein HMPREF3174_01690 [Trueperella sp. HMSC08H06]